MSNVISIVMLIEDKYCKWNINYSGSQLVGGWPVGYLHSAVDELNSGLPRKNPDGGRVEDLNQGPPGFKSSTLTHPTTPQYSEYKYVPPQRVWWSFSVVRSDGSEIGFGFIRGNHDDINLIFSLQLALYLEQKRKKTKYISLYDKVPV